MNFIYLVIILGCFLGTPIYLLLNKIIKKIKNDVSKMEPLERGMTDVYIILSAFVIVIYLGDKFNIFSDLRITNGLTTNYDWLAFLGTIISMFINALFVLMITINDRRENTESIRQSQRPYLTTTLYYPNDYDDEEIIEYGFVDDKKVIEY